MGTSGWYYFTPFRGNINAALQAARHNAFDRGEYGGYPDNDWRRMTEDQLRASLAAESDSSIRENIIDEWQYAKTVPEPMDITTLLFWNGGNATQSVIDIEKGTSLKPRTGTVSPLEVWQLFDFFGTLQPSHGRVKHWLERVDLSQIRQKGQGLYIIVYRDGIADEVCFAGFSGD